MVFSNNLLAAAASQTGGGGGYAISNSAMFDKANTEFFSDTPGAGDQQKWTISFWVKMCDLTTRQCFISQDAALISVNENAVGSNRITMYIAGSSPVWYWETSATNGLFRDPTAWYNIVVAFDSTNGTADHRLRLYINGVEFTDFQKYSTGNQNSSQDFGNSAEIRIGEHPSGTSIPYDGYMAEFVWIDGTQHAPTSFGEFDEYGVWKPIDVSGLTFGTKGWYLPFTNSPPFGTFGESDNGTLSINSINPNSIGYTFTAPSTTTLTTIQFEGVSGTTGNVDAYIYTNNSGSPGSVAKSLGTFATANAVFSITADFSMTAGTVYWIVLIPNGTIDQQLRTVSVSTANPIASGRTDNGGAATTITVGKNTSLNWRVNLLTSAAGLGTDASGNGFNFTNNNSVSQSGDSPTSNVSVLNPLWTSSTLSQGNLKASNSATAYNWAISTIAIPSTGKWVFEGQSSNANGSNKWALIGICQMGNHNVKAGLNYIYALNVGNGEVIKNSSAVATVTAPTTSLIRVEYNASTDQITFFDDNSQVHQATAGLTGEDSLHFFVAPLATSGTADMTATFTGLTNTPTADFLELKASNFSEPSVPDGSAQHQAILWSGNSSSQTVSQAGNSGFTPDWTIIKSRSFANGANSFDVVRGSTKGLATFDEGAEDTNSDGVAFGIGSGKGTLGFTGSGNTGDINNSGRTYVGLTWKAGGSASTNEVGSINSSVSANTTSGTAIGTYTGTGSAATIGHGLGLVPRMVWIKNRAEANWAVYSAVAGAEFYQRLDTEQARADDSSFFNDTTPTTTVFSIGADSTATSKAGNNYVFYAMADVEGYQKIGEYTGNFNVDGPVITTGFKPQYVMIKSTTQVSTNWEFFCDEIEPYNELGDQNYFNIASAEADNDHNMDWLANGFKIRDRSGSVNASGATYLYWAIAKYPFGGTCPAPAR